MLYVLIPHAAQTWESFRMFVSYSAAEHFALHVAKDLVSRGYDPDWCCVVGYSLGIDEYHPTFMYTVVDSTRLARDRIPTPSS